MKRPIRKDDWNKRCVFLDEVDSTNRFALELVRRERPPSGTVVRTGFQSEGRGQRGKTWLAEPGDNALFSYITYPGLNPAEHFKLNKMVSVAIWKALQKLVAPADVSLKWPNDIYLGRKKCAGILIQNVIKGRSLDHCVIGIGINVNQTVFPEDLTQATSLALEKGHRFDILDVTQRIVASLDEVMNKSNVKDIDSVYSDNLYLLGETWTFHEGNHSFEGMIQGVDLEGLLEVKVGDKVKKYSFGEIKYG